MSNDILRPFSLQIRFESQLIDEQNNDNLTS